MKRQKNKGVSRRQFVRNTAFGGMGVLCTGLNIRHTKNDEAVNALDSCPAKEVIIDSHCHAWNYWPYDPPVPDPQSRGRVEQLINQMDLHGVDQATIVAAQITHNPTNNDYVADAVRRFPKRLHQFADVDSLWSSTYHKPGAAKRMESAIKQYQPKGFTHYLSEDDDGHWLNTSEGNDFLAVAAEAGLIASIACSPHHQPALRKAAERFQSLPILCHHMSGLKAAEQAPHKKLKEVLASSALPNIYLKLSGFAYLSDDDKKFEFPYSDTQWIYKACYEQYGSRMVWGSDFPVVNFFMTYQQSLEAFRKHCSFVKEADKTAILGGTLQGLLWASDK